MKKIWIPAIAALTAFWVSAGTGQHDVTVLGVEVPVRVMDGNQFVDNLSLADFELFENGVKQTVSGMYLIRKTDVERKESDRDGLPRLNRNFYMLFQLNDYNPRLNDAIDYFFEKVFIPGDAMTVMTVQNRYQLSPAALQSKSREKLAEELKKIVRRDSAIGNSNYNTLLRELKRITAGIGAGGGAESGAEEGTTTLELLFPRYKDSLNKMDQMRVVDEKSFLQFAASLRNIRGNKHVFFFYEKEYRPEIQQSDLNRLLSNNQDNPNILAHLQDLFQLYARTPSIDPQRIQQAFGDSGICLHFLFINKEPELEPGIFMREQSEDIYDSFSQVATVTGGVIDTSLNPAASFEKAVDAAESYYLLYYTPLNNIEDGKFREIRVKVTGKNYTLRHRPGYFARR
ncbi:MAG: VWA domain-containing protein [Candidatus Aminicenantes bacterium]|nr:VWA domain-containing protein [Candidatus Aminicenantes bacterium]